MRPLAGIRIIESSGIGAGCAADSGRRFWRRRHAAGLGIVSAIRDSRQTGKGKVVVSAIIDGAAGAHLGPDDLHDAMAPARRPVMKERVVVRRRVGAIAWTSVKRSMTMAR